MELKVWVEGIQRIVCGVTEKTTCQDVVYALAHATGKTGRFTLIERWRNSERLLAPQEHPLKVLQKRGEYMSEVQFILKRSALDNSTKPPASSAPSNSSSHPLSPRLHRARYSSSAGLANHSKSLPPFEAVWKPPPPGIPIGSKPIDNNRLSPDSGRGSDKTGSDTSNGYSDKEMGGGVSGYRRYALGHPSQQPLPDYGFTNPKTYPPAYRPPPPPHPRNASPSDPPPYRAPPPPGVRFRPPKPTSPTAVVRPPHYSPPPVHRTPHLSRHPSKSSLVGIDKGDRSSKSLMGKNNPPSCSSISNNYCNSASNIQYSRRAIRPSHLEIQDLYNLISAQQSAIHSQQTELKKYDSEVGYLEGHGYSSSSTMLPDPLTPSLDVVVSEVRRLEEVSQRNENELCHLGLDAGGNASNTNSAGGAPSLFKEDAAIRDEISQLKQRLAGTDQELQKTNATLKHLGDEMRSMSIEKSKQKEQELMSEVEKLHEEIKSLQKSSEEGANISQHLSVEVQEMEEQIRQRKSEVEKLIQEMREVNMETLVISPPEESKQFLDGPPRPGSSRKMLGSPRQLENAVPTSKNPHGVWV
ncbi:uncharacterized protein RASSF8 isoform X2 [Lepeophtheirus salmonis]|nr:ras association domain-containing protein 8-like isoform X2 [Lepeophtheirus salmonis]